MRRRRARWLAVARGAVLLAVALASVALPAAQAAEAILATQAARLPGAKAAERSPAAQSLPLRVTLDATEFDGVWWLPSRDAVGIVVVQHGFARRCEHLRGTLAALAQGGFIVLCLDAEMAGGNPKLASALAAALRDGLAPPGHAGASLPIVVGGHSAGALFASHLGAALAREAPGRLAGALLFDPVAGTGFADKLLAISDGGARPVRAISAAFSGCNAGNNADPALAAVMQAAHAAGRDGFVGLRLVDRSTHIDAEGEDTSALAVWACGQGAPQPANVALLRELATVWALDMVLKRQTPELTRMGKLVDEALAEGRAVPIR